MTRRISACAMTFIAACLASIPLTAGAGVQVVDLSESGAAFRFRVDHRAVHAAVLAPGDVLEFQVSGAVEDRPLRFRVDAPPGEVAPAVSFGGFRWAGVPFQVRDGVLTFDVLPRRERFLVRLRPPAPRRAAYYDYTRYLDYVAAIQGEPLAQVTKIGTSVQGRPLYRVLIDDPAYPPGLKKTVVMVVRQHGDEYGSSYLLEGTLDLLLGRGGLQPDPDLRRRVRWIVYPLVNPDGAVANQRQNANGVDLNRDWSAAGCDAGQQVETFAAQCDLESLHAVWAVLRGGDHHGWDGVQHGGYRYALAAPPSNVTPAEYGEAVKDTEVVTAYDPTQVDWQENGGTPGMFRVEMFLSQGILSHTAEYNGAISTAAEFHEKGQRWAEAMLDTLYGPALTDGRGIPVSTIALPDEIYVTVDDFDQNADPATVESVAAVVLNNATGDRERLVLAETGPDTGLFRNAAALPFVGTSGAPAPNDGTLEGTNGSFVRAWYADPDYAPDRSFTFARVP